MRITYGDLLPGDLIVFDSTFSLSDDKCNPIELLFVVHVQNHTKGATTSITCLDATKWTYLPSPSLRSWSHRLSDREFISSNDAHLFRDWQVTCLPPARERT